MEQLLQLAKDMKSDTSSSIIQKEPNGIEVFTIISAPDFIHEIINKPLSSGITDLINN